MPNVIIHIQNDDPVLGELDALPAVTDQMVIVKNPRRKDGKDIGYIDPKVMTVIWPLSKITFIEVLPSGEEEEIISFVRE
jgi:hypothetical protein